MAPVQMVMVLILYGFGGLWEWGCCQTIAEHNLVTHFVLAFLGISAFFATERHFFGREISGMFWEKLHIRVFVVEVHCVGLYDQLRTLCISSSSGSHDSQGRGQWVKWVRG